MQVNTEAPANEAKAEVRESRLWPCGWWFRWKKHREFHLDKKHMEFFFKCGVFTGMSLYSIA